MNRTFVFAWALMICFFGAFNAQAQDYIWFVPGFQVPNSDFSSITDKLQAIYPDAKIEVKHWDAPRNENSIQTAFDWGNAMAKVPQAAAKLAEDIEEFRDSKKLTIVGYSLGAMVTIKALAKCKNTRIHSFVLLGAAMNNDDSDVEKALDACRKQSFSIFYPGDSAMVGYTVAEKHAALGTGYTKIVDSDDFCEIAMSQGKHDAIVFLKRLEKAVVDGDDTSDEIIVPQDSANVIMPVTDGKVWWDVLDESHEWELQKNKVSGHCRILSPDDMRCAYGRQVQMVESFEKVKAQLNARFGVEQKKAVPNDWWTLIKPIQDNTNANTATMGGTTFWNNLDTYRGWKLQKNTWTGHCRILDPVDVRRAWGSESKMRESFNDVKRQIDALGLD